MIDIRLRIKEKPVGRITYFLEPNKESGTELEVLLGEVFLKKINEAYDIVRKLPYEWNLSSVDESAERLGRKAFKE